MEVMMEVYYINGLIQVDLFVFSIVRDVVVFV